MTLQSTLCIQIFVLYFFETHPFTQFSAQIYFTAITHAITKYVTVILSRERKKKYFHVQEKSSVRKENLFLQCLKKVHFSGFGYENSFFRLTNSVRYQIKFTNLISTLECECSKRRKLECFIIFHPKNLRGVQQSKICEIISWDRTTVLFFSEQ